MNGNNTQNANPAPEEGAEVVELRPQSAADETLDQNLGELADDSTHESGDNGPEKSQDPEVAEQQVATHELTLEQLMNKVQSGLAQKEKNQARKTRERLEKLGALDDEIQNRANELSLSVQYIQTVVGSNLGRKTLARFKNITTGIEEAQIFLDRMNDNLEKGNQKVNELKSAIGKGEERFTGPNQFAEAVKLVASIGLKMEEEKKPAVKKEQATKQPINQKKNRAQFSRSLKVSLGDIMNGDEKPEEDNSGNEWMQNLEKEIEELQQITGDCSVKKVAKFDDELKLNAIKRIVELAQRIEKKSAKRLKVELFETDAENAVVLGTKVRITPANKENPKSKVDGRIELWKKLINLTKRLECFVNGDAEENKNGGSKKNKGKEEQPRSKKTQKNTPKQKEGEAPKKEVAEKPKAAPDWKDPIRESVEWFKQMVVGKEELTEEELKNAKTALLSVLSSAQATGKIDVKVVEVTEEEGTEREPKVHTLEDLLNGEVNVPVELKLAKGEKVETGDGAPRLIKDLKFIVLRNSQMFQ